MYVLIPAEKKKAVFRRIGKFAGWEGVVKSLLIDLK